LTTGNPALLFLASTNQKRDPTQNTSTLIRSG
jgi:hypothetical protein